MKDISNEVDQMIINDKKLSRNIKIYLSQRYTGERLDDIGRDFGIGGSGVCQMGRRIAKQLEKDAKLARMVKRIEDKMSRMKP